MAGLIQRSFSGGELAPSLHARTDASKYATGAKTLRNMMTMRHGGATNRPGGTFVAEVKDSSKSVRLIPFIFNTEQTYVLEFGDEYMRVHQNGELLTLASQNVTAITKANPAVVTIVGHGLTTGDEVKISGVAGMTEVNGWNFVITVLGVDTFSLSYKSGVAVNSSSFGAYTSGGIIEKVYALETQYIEDDLSSLQFVQSADVITIAHQNYPPHELTRAGHTSWTLEQIDFEPDALPPTDVTNSAVSFAKVAITNISAATPAVFTTAAHGLATGDHIQAWGWTWGVPGYSFYNAPTVKLIVTVLTPTTFTAKYLASNGDFVAYLPYISGGYIQTIYTSASTTNRYTYEYGVTAIKEDNYEESVISNSTGTETAATVGAPITISWTAASNAIEYNIYKKLNGKWGFLGKSGTTSFKDIGLDPDVTDGPPITRNPFDRTGKFPATVTYVQQRLAFGNTEDEPEKVWLSRSGRFHNYTVSSPIQDDDAVTFALAGRRVNAVKHLVDLNGLAVLTAGGEWTINGNDNGVITPIDISPKQVTYNGSSDLAPIIINGNCLYIQARGSIVRDLVFDYQTDGYRGNDITIFSAHLFEGHTIVDWAFQQTPHSIVWCVREDGVLLACTYVRDQEMLAWHHHDLQGGFVENVCVVPEGTNDYLYLTVRRTINGRTTRYIERMASRTIDDVKDMIFMDSALTFDGRNTNDSHTQTLSGGTSWEYNEDLTLTSSTSYFETTDVGNEIHLTIDEEILRLRITAYTSATVVTVRANKTVPASFRSAALSTWALAVDELSGLQHLEGEPVAVLGDGYVVASPNNDSYTTLTVESGAVTLPRCYTVIQVGLPYISDIETLNIDTNQGMSVAMDEKLVNKVAMHVEKSRGIFVGNAPPTDDTIDPLEGLTEMKLRSEEDSDEPNELKTEVIDLVIQGSWNRGGRVFIRQVDPLPLTVLSVMPEGVIPLG